MGTLWGLKTPEEGVGTLWCLGTPSSATGILWAQVLPTGAPHSSVTGTLWNLDTPQQGKGLSIGTGYPMVERWAPHYVQATPQHGKGHPSPWAFAHPKGSCTVGAKLLQVPYGSWQPRGTLPATPWVPATPQCHGAGHLLPSVPAGTSGPGWR